MERLERERARRVAVEEKKAGVREGHYNLGDEFVVVWVDFYPRVQWYIADARRTRPSGQRISGTTRKLTDDVKVKLESWL